MPILEELALQEIEIKLIASAHIQSTQEVTRILSARPWKEPVIEDAERRMKHIGQTARAVIITGLSLCHSGSTANRFNNRKLSLSACEIADVDCDPSITIHVASDDHRDVALYPTFQL